MLPLDRSPWLPVYQEAARWIPTSSPVVDLGCGTGRFLAQLASTSHYAALEGVDFSPLAVAEARSYLLTVFEDEMAYHHRVTLRVCDLRTWGPTENGAGRATYTCLEVLEHLEDDLALVRRVPTGHQFVFSVPNYLSASHVRCFPTLADVFGRYGPLLALTRWSLVDFGGGNIVHVLDSTRRHDAW